MDALVDVARINLAWREEVALLVDVQVGKDPHPLPRDEFCL